MKEPIDEKGTELDAFRTVSREFDRVWSEIETLQQRLKPREPNWSLRISRTVLGVLAISACCGAIAMAVFVTSWLIYSLPFVGGLK